MRRFKQALTTAVLTALLVGSTAGWASESTGSALSGPLPGTAAWLADESLGKELPDPTTATPSEVAVFFADLTDTQQRRLAQDHPTVVGNLDGVPVSLRYEANASAGEQVLAYDPRGRGLIVRVAGDLENATHVSVLVPGSDIDISTFDRTAQSAADLQEEAGDDTAVIAWAGYTTPSGIGPDLATGRLAETGAERLTRFTEGLDATGLPDPSLFCHSYGSVVCGLAAPDTDASDIVVMGSPGMRADDVTALGTDAHVWAAKSPDDWIDRVPNVEVLGLGHGADPTSPDFGATVLPADDVPAHDEYFTPGTSTLTAFAAIAGGDL
ncbi:alpha/beta hydrolase family protein [Streptomyces phaeochromogenes]|uniref:alpha/beta hydrolase n=1 Tax=Streptomyces phaeochromogenes TaxID=1923 RepID=UPI0022566B38|nr:alpha/beta hydrolase [Streptomyces phaeochromogenes]MCX5602419.1 alpha/beta hydrolase family protein [Streptomyces phaeochromogenes]WRZ26806.1 alpha/beta hydrolase family protein [Streptomyces phaeochromogenes]